MSYQEIECDLSLQDDLFLYQMKDEWSLKELSDHFSVTETFITNRLEQNKKDVCLYLYAMYNIIEPESTEYDIILWKLQHRDLSSLTNVLHQTEQEIVDRLEKLRDPDIYNKEICETKGTGMCWSLRDDFILYELHDHDENNELLANRFNRTRGAIHARLLLLNNTDRKGHRRLMKQYGGIDSHNWTQEMDDRLLELRDKGIGIREMEKRFEMDEKYIYGRLYLLEDRISKSK